MRTRLLLAPAALAAACVANETTAPGPRSDLERRARMFAGRREIDVGTLWRRLARADAVFLGEAHLDETTHAFELAAYRALSERRPVTLALEMFQRDVQPALDAYLAGRIDEPEFLRAARPWSNYRTGYRPLIEHARQSGGRVVASNAPRSVLRKVRNAEALAALPAGERALLPPAILPNSKAYWERFRRAVRGHMGAGGGDVDPQAMLYTTQSLWDNTMGWSCAQALEREPRSLVLHVNGGFHSAYRQGTVEQLLKRRPGANALTVDLVATGSVADVDPGLAAGRADFVVYLQRRGRGLQKGTHAVTVSPELRFRLHVPENEDGPLPLLVWLPDRGQRPEDALAYWRAALGEASAVAVVEPPHRETAGDLHVGGRWFFTDWFDHDVAVASGAVPEIARYVGRHYRIAEDRIVVAGRGSGATVAVKTALHAAGLRARVFAADPRAPGKLGEAGLPDPREHRRRRPLTISSAPEREDWWKQETARYTAIGLPAHVQGLPPDELAIAMTIEDGVRSGLRIEPVATTGDVTLVLDVDTPLARDWAILAARRRGDVRAIARGTGGSGGKRHHLRFDAGRNDCYSPDDLSARKLPVHSSPFGGTTLLVVPQDASPELRAEWRALLARDPLRRRSLFTRLALAFEDAEPGLTDALEKLSAAGRRNVLIVPAMWCAGAGRMQALHQAASASSESMDLEFLPGLGAGL